MRVAITKETLEKHLQQIENLKSGFDAAPFHVVITDENANIIYVNKAVEQHTGFTREDCIGKNTADLWGGKMPKSFYEEMWRTIKVEKKPFSGQTQNIRKDGTMYWQELLITPVLDEKGDVKFFIGIEPSITDQKKREEFRDQFVSALGHQVRNPLITIRWVLEELLASANLGESERQDLEKAYRENQTLTDLIKDLLILSRVESHAMESETVRLDEELVNIVESVQKNIPGYLFLFKMRLDQHPLQQ